MTPDQAISQAKGGNLLPVYLVAGEDTHTRSRVVAAIKQAALEGAVPGLNDDHWDAADVAPGAVINAARTLPMMAARRLVLITSIERWETKADAKKVSGLDVLAEYAKDPSPSSVVVLVAGKLDKRRRLVTQAQKGKWLVNCEPLRRDALPGWIIEQAKSRGHAIAPASAELLADAAGPELAQLADALERISLFVGDAAEITDDAIAECVNIIRPATVWELVDAVGNRNLGRALSILTKVYDPQDRGLRLIGVLAWSSRQLLRFGAAVREGLPPPEAAKRAGAPPFKARQLSQQLKRLSLEQLEGWLPILAEADIALKGGSKKPPSAILDDVIFALCGAG